MKFIPMDFSHALLLPNGKRNSFYENALPTERVRAGEFFPIFPLEESREAADTHSETES